MTIRLAHVAGVVDKLAERLPSSPKFDSRTDGIEPPVMFEAGEQIGWFLLDGQALDFGLYNTEHINMFINQERYTYTNVTKEFNSHCNEHSDSNALACS